MTPAAPPNTQAPPLYTFGGDGPVLHLAVANGFPPETYRALLAPLTDRYRVVCTLPRPLWGPPAPPPSTLTSWQDAATDILDGLRAHGLARVVGVGHSYGAVATLMAAVRAPERFRGLALLDPTMFPPRILWPLRAMRVLGLRGRYPLVRTALRRRAQFASRQAAFDYWRGKRLFADWHDAALWDYVDGLVTPDGGGGVTLRWPPSWEARMYGTVALWPWDALARWRGPLLVVRGGASNTFFADAAARLRRARPDATYTELDGVGHLFPQAAPDAARAPLERWLATLA